MSSSRITAFSDGVMAILITIMVLNLHEPSSYSWSALLDLKFVFLSYLVSFMVLAIYWNNHHHMFQLPCKITGRILWWNMALLFAMSLMPFSTAWMAEFPARQAPELLFGLNCLLIDLIYDGLAFEVFRQQKTFGKLREASWFWKCIFSVVILVVALLIAVLTGWNFLSMAAVVVSLSPWVIPDRQIERRINESQ